MAEIIEEIKIAEVDIEAPEVEKELAPGVDRKLMRRRLDSAIKSAIPTLEVDDHLLELAELYHDAVEYDAQRDAARDLQQYVSERVQDYSRKLKLDKSMKYTRARSICAVVMGEPRAIAITVTVRGKQQLFRKWEAEVRGYFVIKLGEFSDA